MSAINLAIIGECMIELSMVQNVSEQSSSGDTSSVKTHTTIKQSFGGDSMNTAIYLKKLAGSTVSVHYVSSMGSDPLSTALIKQWQDHGINTDSVLINPDKHAGLYMIQNDANGERTFQYWRNDSAAKYLVQHSDFEKTVEKLKGFNAIYLSGISLAILPEKDSEILVHYLTKLANTGVNIIFDSNYRPALWSSKAHCQKITKRIYALSTLALVTFEDEHELWADNSIEDCRTRLHQQGVKELVIKDGENGCQYSINTALFDTKIEYFATKKVDNVVDTTAAGDSFNAGFLAYWFQSSPIEQCANAGNQLAGQVIQKKGAIVKINTDLIDQ
ncbi:sugar kinase [Colwellia sp. MB02u-18]|uniref:sugar kinase n=1 Tax=unclassified Colwellia TaxID=196834 RepID=UPI0015F6ED18|nr:MULTISPECIES: sugar kinase [unclassified Colwellia]MBA6222637.1 sugar kinase [Colwellia sp. MB3u-45]MBA6269175.1 sugar kinase [Colwellia sp. MB3u-43]MBA6322770.1 sugar kinase [Colwellia sp. MB02u-19]MBA6323457.1 sugar kinase [Colwellia sp. MB02u-18]MBA6332913.1 sugar kinase [Colwellia sp. MB02u-12]